MIPESQCPPAARIRIWWAWTDGVVHYGPADRRAGTHLPAAKHMAFRYGIFAGIQAKVDGEWADVVPDKDYEALADYELRRE